MPAERLWGSGWGGVSRGRAIVFFFRLFFAFCCWPGFFARLAEWWFCCIPLSAESERWVGWKRYIRSVYVSSLAGGIVIGGLVCKNGAGRCSDGARSRERRWISREKIQ
ncbi:hypothetical protein J3F83DRAFT_732641 [Trichoderma novae-zelandiae]